MQTGSCSRQIEYPSFFITVQFPLIKKPIFDILNDISSLLRGRTLEIVHAVLNS